VAGLDVWLPIGNAASTLPRALASLSRQTFRDWRLVAVDDGSTDGSAEVAERAGYRVIRRPHGGIVAALAACAEASDAPLVARMDADDTAHRERFAEQARLAATADVVATRVRVSGTGLRDYVRWQNGLVTHESIVRDLFVESPLVHPSVVFRRDAYERAGGYRTVDWPEDYDLWMRMARAGARFAKVPRVLLSWNDRPGRLTRTHRMYREEAYFAIKRHYLRDHAVLARGPVTVWGAGPIGRWWVHRLTEDGIVVEQAIDIDARKIGRRLGNRVPVRAPEEALARRRGGIVGAVGSKGARAVIRRELERAGLVELADFVFVA